MLKPTPGVCMTAVCECGALLPGPGAPRHTRYCQICLELGAKPIPHNKATQTKEKTKAKRTRTPRRRAT